MSLSGKVVTRVFQLCMRNNVLNCRQASCSYLLRQPSYFRNTLFKSARLVDNFFVANLSTQTNISPARAMGALSPLDPSSFSRPELAIIRHISLALNVDFEKQVLRGEATLNFDVLTDINDLPLDVSNIKIESIETEGGTQLQYKLGEHIPNYGSKLTVILPKQVASGEKKDAAMYSGHSADIRSANVGSAIRRGDEIKDAAKDNSTSDFSFTYKGFLYQNTSSVVVCAECPTGVSSSNVAQDDECLYKLDEESSIAERSFELAKRVHSATCFLAQDTIDEREEHPGVSMPVSKVGEMSAEAACCPHCCMKSSEVYEGFRLSIKIKYTTDPSASALQWLDAAQTSGKKHPYLFSQCQPIHARSILPCQDTPAVKFTYDAVVTAPEEFTVLMSALRGEVKNNKTSFTQPMPLPSYLVALAVGVLESRTLGPRSKVWSEKEEIERSAWEFAETEKYLQAAEKMCGPYEWTEYDLLVLPPSFPYGGMENPCLTFVTPTLLAGDRSQADVIVHEIMHSWTGNLVTNRNFEHFWLNEGFTVYLERKVAASLINDSAEAKRSRDFHSLLGLQELSEAVDHFGASNPLTNLVVNLDGVHPDDAFSRVPYEKGSLFLRYLEDLTGGPEVFDDFLRSYLSKFRKKSLDTDQFKAYLLEYFKDNDKLKNLDWHGWLETSGMPPIIPDYDTTMTKAVTTLVGKLDKPNVSFLYSDVETLTPHQLIHLLQQLLEKPPLALEHIRAMGSEYKIVGNKNTEILYRWLRLCVRSKDESKLSEVFSFLNSNGRMKYVRPLYRDLYAWEDVREQTIDNFLKNEKNMMHVSAYTLRKDLHLSE